MSDLQEVGRYASHAEAVEDGLVVLAMGEAYWMFPDEGGYVLCVQESVREAVVLELAEVSRLRSQGRGWSIQRGDFVVQRVGSLSFWVYGLILVGVFLAQWFGSVPITEDGRLDALVMVRENQWWRAVTALTLHGDVGHLVGNLAAGAGFGFWLARYLGAAWGWTLILLCGVFGNVLTALLYYPNPHLSIGASTAVFAALGLLTGFGWYHSRGGSRKGHSIPEWILPILAGLTLLGMLGAGGPRTDLIAHLCGFGSGLVVSVLVSYLPWSLPTSRSRRWIGWLPLAIIAIAWTFALS